MVEKGIEHVGLSLNFFGKFRKDSPSASGTGQSDTMRAERRLK